MTGDGINGYIALIDNETKRLTYLIKYKRQTNTGIFGGAVTQVKLWRDFASLSSRGITSFVFFEILLKKWPAIMSDEQQTIDGERFWRTRMAEAAASGYQVGLFDINKNHIEWCDKSQPFRNWLAANDAWGVERKHRYLRYIIKV